MCVSEYFPVYIQILPIHPYFPLSISCAIGYVPVSMCVSVYSTKCWLGELTLSAIYLEGMTLANCVLNQCSITF